MQTFSKDERLTSKRLFTQLLHSGTSFFVHPFKVVWLDAGHEGSKPVQVAISVPKKKFKRAVDRNRVKRLTREAWRKNKQQLYDVLVHKERKGVLLLVYTANTQPVYIELEGKIKFIIQRLIKHAESA